MPALRETRGLLRAILSRRGAVFLGSVTYVSAASLRVAEGEGLRPWALSLLALLVTLRALSPRTAPLGHPREVAHRTDPGSLALWALAITLAALGAPRQSAWLDVAGAIGAATSTFVAAAATARIVGPPGLASQRGERRSLAVRMLLACAWAIAIGASLAAALHRDAWGVSGVSTGILAAASVACGAVLVYVAWYRGVVGRLELGVTTRAHASAALSAILLATAAAATLFDAGALDRTMRLALGLAAVLQVWIALHADAVAVGRVSRHLLALAIFGGPVILLGASAAEGMRWHAPGIVVATSLVAITVGALSPWLQEPFRPAGGAWLDAVKRAHDLITQREPDEAVRGTLTTLREPAGAQAASPELWTLDPPRVLTIDAAGYPRTRPGELPEGLLEIASKEPHATLRLEVLEMLEVRRPDLRPLARWLDDRGAMLATVVTGSGEPEGLLVLPSGNRTEPLAPEEALAIKSLADALAAACHVKGALARSLSREAAATQRADLAEDRAARLAHQVDLDVGRNVLASTRLARPATVGVYSATSRMAYEAIERRIGAGAPVAIVAPSGVSAVPYIARAHLVGPRSSGPLVLVDGTSSRDHDPERWADGLASPLALADRGLLVLHDGASLPVDVQRIIARALAERRPPWERAEPLDVALAFIAVLSPEQLVAAGRLDPMLASRLGDAESDPIALPHLRDRAEDLRAIIADRLAREGLRVRGTPVGIDDLAFARLLEHPFLGEEAELSWIVARLVADLRGDVVSGADVEALLVPIGQRPRKSASGGSGAI